MQRGKQKTFREKVLQALSVFLVLMILFTLLSRVASNVVTPVVETVQPKQDTLVYNFSAAGTVEENQVRAVNVAAGLQVKNVLVKEGDRVKKGEILFKLDRQNLEEKILLKKQELQKLKLGISDFKENKSMELDEKKLEQNRAGEDYQRAAGSADSQVQRAYETMMNAWNRLKMPDSQEGEAVFDSGDAVQQALADTSAEKAKLLRQAADELEKREKELKQAQTDLNIASDVPKPMAPDEEILFGDGSPNYAVEAYTEEAYTEDAYTEDAYTEDAYTAETYAEGQDDLIQNKTADKEALELLKKKVQEAQDQYDRAEKEKTEADNALAQYASQKGEQDREKEAEQQRELEEIYIQAKNAYEDAMRQREDAVSAAGRKIEDAQKPQAADSTGSTLELDLEVQKLELEKYLALKKKKGIVKSPADGVIRRIDVEAGGFTAEGSAVTMADLSAGLRLVAAVPIEQAQFLNIGDDVRVKASVGSREIEGLTVNSIKLNAEDSGLADITVRMKSSQAELGSSAAVKAEKKSMPYACTLPVEALHMDKEQYYVLVLQEVDTVLGKELRTARIDVNVLKKNTKLAAIEDHVLSGTQQVIVFSEKPLKSGDRVRLKEE